MFAVEADGRLVGDVQGRCLRFAMPPGVWELGIELWDAADRGRGIGRQTIALLSSHLFEREDAIRVQATTDVDNVAMRRVLEHLGFAFEGVLRGFMPAGSGPPRDYAMYGLTRAAGERAEARTATTVPTRQARTNGAASASCSVAAEIEGLGFPSTSDRRERPWVGPSRSSAGSSC